MRLESALYIGREGLSSNGAAISVVGDNISNSNTVGYKSSRVEFADLLAEGMAGGSSTTLPATGSGVMVSSVRPMFEGGVIEQTGRDLDVAIDGGGFFILGSADKTLYSRAGNFEISQDGYLVNADGMQVMGLAPGGTALAPLNLYSVNTSGAATSTAAMVGNVDASMGIVPPLANTESFKAIDEAASFSAPVSVYDSLGQRHDLLVAFCKTGTNTWTAQAYVDGADVGQTAGVPVQVGQTATLTFSQNGVIEAANQAAAAITATPAWSNGAAAGNFAINLSAFTQYASPSTLSNVSQNGQNVGNVESYSVTMDGRLMAKLDSGTSILIGTIQLATFTNEDGLQRAGNTMFQATTGAGEATVANPASGDYGALRGASLERSTVDISTQFIDLVMYQRGYQASSQTISTASQMLRDTLNLLR